MNSVTAAWRIYGRESLAVRLHVALRALTCPFAPLIAGFPAGGSVLDVGCGHGLLLGLLAAQAGRAGLRLSGIDHDADKIAAARRAGPAGADFSCRPLAGLPESAYDAVSIVDVLYTVRIEVWKEILAGCARVLRPGGILIVKEVVDRPRWKYWAIMAQEALSVRVFGITKGERPHFESVQIYRRAIEAAGLRLRTERPLESWSWISHHLFTAEKPR